MRLRRGAHFHAGTGRRRANTSFTENCVFKRHKLTACSLSLGFSSVSFLFLKICLSPEAPSGGRAHEGRERDPVRGPLLGGERKL